MGWLAGPHVSPPVHDATVEERLSALEFRRKPRASPEAEQALADIVRSADAGGARFRRHHAVGPYVLDLYCPERRLAVEIASLPPVTSGAAFDDQVRRRYLSVLGIRVLAFAEADVLHDGGRVAAAIEEALARAGAEVRATSARGPSRR